MAGLVNKLKTTRPNHAKYALRTILPADTAAFCGSKKNPKSSIVDRSNKFKDKIPWYNRAENEKVRKLEIYSKVLRYKTVYGSLTKPVKF